MTVHPPPRHQPITVLLADDNPVVRAVLRDLLSDGGHISVVGEAANGVEALELADALRPDVTLLDHRMPLRDGLSVVVALTGHTRVLMLTRSAEEDVVLQAVRAGALGYLVHGQFNPAELVTAVRAVASGEAHLSPTAARVLIHAVRTGAAQEPPHTHQYGLSRREREVMDLIAQGMSNASVAMRLFLAPKTVQNHVNRIFAKLGAGNRSEAIAIWRGEPTAVRHP
ncbi:response regulator transcription factor [Luedemannella flava]|uniref:Response regulator transcription factor n=1 Tax=Luedemannella flava TaxID=349316 RepID=A0ABN2M3T3_9ACTN